MTTCAVFAVVLLAIATTQANILPTKCSLVEYVKATQDCIKDLPIRDWKDGLGKACRTDVFNKLATCQGRVNKKCGLTVLSKAKIAAIGKIVCDNVQYLKSAEKCVLEGYPEGMDCVKSIYFERTATDPLCKLTNDFRTCAQHFVQSCDEGVKNILNALMEELYLSCGNGKCTLATYSATSFMCWFPYSQRVQPGSIGDVVCDQDLRLSLGYGCQRIVDERCGYSAVNIPEVEMALDRACINRNELNTLPMCADVESFARCITRVARTRLSAIEYYDEARTCFDKTFAACSQTLQAKMNTVFDIFAPRTRSTIQDVWPKGGRECSNLEHLAGLAICYAPMDIDNLNFYKLVKTSIEKDCSNQVSKAALACHHKIDQFCGTVLPVPCQ